MWNKKTVIGFPLDGMMIMMTIITNAVYAADAALSIMYDIFFLFLILKYKK
jgi:hypothetical protein